MLANYREEIEAGHLRALLIDECHLMWGDLNGYVWGTSDEEIAVRVVNEREKQTYYGAVDYVEGELRTYCIRQRKLRKYNQISAIFADSISQSTVANFLGWCYLSPFQGGSSFPGLC